MKITVTEALRLKNEVSNVIKTLNYSIHQSSFGETTEDDEIISQDKDKFQEVETALILGLSYSEELNNSLSKFNKENGVDSTVRRMQNAKLLLDVYSRNLSKTKPTKQKRFENLGNIRKSIEIIYTPFISSKEMKSKISEQKAICRELQTKVEQLNQKTLEVSFNYKEIESLTQ